MEQSSQAVKEQITQMRSEITALRLQLEESKNEEHQQRREIAEVLTKINVQLGKIK
jgi:septal ring factor EnvC (AmiA/AmiB activator)